MLILFAGGNMTQTYSDTQGLPVKFHYDEKRKETIVVLLEDISYSYLSTTYTIPEGFDSDGASIPQLAWRLVGHPFDMRYLLQAVFHDWLYRFQPLSRKVSDKVLYTDTKGRLCWFRRLCIYIALRAFGWIAWNNHKKALRRQQENS